MSLGAMQSKDAVVSAIREFDELGRDAFLNKYGFGPSRDYVLIFDDKRYDSKAIVGAAHGFEFPNEGPLRSADFSGGKQGAARKLQDLGFEVVSGGEPAT